MRKGPQGNAIQGEKEIAVQPEKGFRFLLQRSLVMDRRAGPIDRIVDGSGAAPAFRDAAGELISVRYSIHLRWRNAGQLRREFPRLNRFQPGGETAGRVRLPNSGGIGTAQRVVIEQQGAQLGEVAQLRAGLAR